MRISLSVEPFVISEKNLRVIGWSILITFNRLKMMLEVVHENWKRS